MMAVTPCIEGDGLLCAAAPTSGHKPECEEQWEADACLAAAWHALGLQARCLCLARSGSCAELCAAVPHSRGPCAAPLYPTGAQCCPLIQVHGVCILQAHTHMLAFLHRSEEQCAAGSTPALRSHGDVSPLRAVKEVLNLFISMVPSGLVAGAPH